MTARVSSPVSRLRGVPPWASKVWKKSPSLSLRTATKDLLPKSSDSKTSPEEGSPAETSRAETPVASSTELTAAATAERGVPEAKEKTWTPRLP